MKNKKLTIVLNPIYTTGDIAGQFLKFEITIPINSEDHQIEKEIVKRLAYQVVKEEEIK